MTRLPLVFLASLAFSGHCVGMCGVFSLSLGTGRLSRAALLQALHQSGKASTYVFLGLLAGAAGARLEPWQRPLGIVAGAALVLVGIAWFVPREAAPRLSGWIARSPACALLSPLTGQASPLAAFSLGVFNGLVPCGLVYAMLAFAASQGSPLRAAATMLVFAAGTAPGLVIVGLGGRWLGAWAARRVPTLASIRLAALLACALGVLTLLRAIDPTDHHLHHALAMVGMSAPP